MPLPALMHPPARHVRRLHVRAESAEDGRRAAVLIGDALHTASLPGADDGRLVVIRRLALGRIPRHASPGTAALLIESRVRETLSAAVWYDCPEAGRAAIVLFPSRPDAIVQLARRHARGAPADDWYWARIVPEWSAPLSRPARWLRLLATAHDFEEAPVTAASLVGEAIAAGALDEMLTAVPPGAGSAWMRALGWTVPEYLPRQYRSPDETLLQHSAHVQAARRAAETWSPTDNRTYWLTGLLAVAEQPARAAQTDLPSRVGAWIRRTIATGPPVSRIEKEVRAPDLSPRPAPADSRESAPAPKLRAARDGCDDAPPRQDAETTEGPLPPTTEVAAADGPAACAQVRRSDESPGMEPNAGAHDPGGEPTAFGGLFFLLNVLRRLRLPAFLERNPRLLDAGFASRVLLCAGQTAGMPNDDPLAVMLATDLAGCEARAGRGGGPFIKSDDTKVVPHVVPRGLGFMACEPLPVRTQRHLRAWILAADRWCQRHGLDGLPELILRPARVHIARAHIDICFKLEHADLALRRLALDVDPGWIPWLGRIIRFHYLTRDELGR